MCFSLNGQRERTKMRNLCIVANIDNRFRMNKFSLSSTIACRLLSLILLTLAGHAAHSQQIRYFPPFDKPVGQATQLQVVGKVGDHYLIYYANPEEAPELLVYDSVSQASFSTPLSFIDPTTTKLVNLLPAGNHLCLIIQEIKNGKHYSRSMLLDKDGQPLKDAFLIDSSRVDVFGSSVFYNILVSPDKQKVALYRIVRGFSSSQIFFTGVLLSNKGERIGNNSFYITINEELETTEPPFMNNDGVFFIAVHDKAGNYKLGSSLRLFQSNFLNQPPRIAEYYFKENKPVDLMMNWQEGKNRLVMGGTYANFYTKNLEGSFTLFWDKDLKKPDTVMYAAMDKRFKKDLKNKVYSIPMNEAINQLQLRYFKVTADGTTTLLMDMFNNFSFFKNTIYANMPTASNRQSNVANNGGNPTSALNAGNSYSNQTINNSTTRTLYNDRASSAIAGQRGRNLQLPSTDMQQPPQPPSLNQMNRNTPQPPAADATTAYAAPISTRDAGDVLMRYKTLDYKSVVFFRNGATGQVSRNWIHNLYVPGTPFASVGVLPFANSQIGLINYEVNAKNMPFLKLNRIGPDGKWQSEIPDKPGKPLLFYRKNMIYCGEQLMLTLYNDPESGTTGIAEISW